VSADGGVQGFSRGAKEWLRSLPGLVVCGGVTTSGAVVMNEAWRLDLGELRWDVCLASLADDTNTRAAR
jgi:hypothetical protein